MAKKVTLLFRPLKKQLAIFPKEPHFHDQGGRSRSRGFKDSPYSEMLVQAVSIQRVAAPLDTGEAVSFSTAQSYLAFWAAAQNLCHRMSGHFDSICICKHCLETWFQITQSTCIPSGFYLEILLLRRSKNLHSRLVNLLN